MKRKFLSRVLSFVLIFALMFGGVVPTFLPTKSEAVSNNSVLKQKMLEELNKRKKHSSKLNEDSDEIVRIMVQLDTRPVNDGGKTSDINQKLEEVKNEISKITSNTSYRQSFTYLLSGFSLDVPKKYVSKIAKIPSIKRITEAKQFYPVMNDAVKLSKAVEVWKSTHYKGEGMVISIVDTGIDTQHKSMRLTDPSKAKIKNVKKGALTKYTMKVPYGWNYADGNDLVKDAEEKGKSQHGMHVAGIVAANDTDADVKAGKGIKGVAPEAQLLAMKVFSNTEGNDSAWTDSVVKAIEDSVELGADVINMSLGGDNGFSNPEDPEAIAIKKATEKGVVVVVAAGNAAMSTTKNSNGLVPENTLNLRDNATVGSPSTAFDSFTVASRENSTATGETAYVLLPDGQKKSFLLKQGGHKEKWDANKEYELADVGLAKKGEVTDEAVKGKVALITRGEIAFSEKLERVQRHGAIGAVVANNVEGTFGMAGIENIEIPSVTIGASQKAILTEAIEKHGKLVMKFTPDFTGAGEPSTFTSYGPTPELEFKPEVMAPGGNIYSTLNNNEYGVMSGTSMATPHVAGSTALLIGAYKQANFNPKGISLPEFTRASLTNTAVPLVDNLAKTGLPYSPRRQGAGAVDLEKALANRVLCLGETGRGFIALKEIGDTASFKVTLTNYGTEVANYSLDYGTPMTEFTDTNDSFKTKDIAIDGAKVNSDVSDVTLAPGESKSVTFTVNVPSTLGNQFVEGYVTFKAKDAKAVDIAFPYMGFHGSWGAEKIVDDTLDTGKSVYGFTALKSGGQILGASIDPVTGDVTGYDKDAVAFSPNGDGTLDSIDVSIGLLRNAKRIETDIVKDASADSEVVAKVGFQDFVAKRSAEKPKPASYLSGMWDGKVYDPAKGELVDVPDGQYVYRIKATTFSNNAEPQYTYIPFKLDRKAPEIIVESKEIKDDKLTIKFRLNEEVTGVDLLGYTIDTNTPALMDINQNNEYTIEIPKEKFGDTFDNHTVSIAVFDKVQNYNEVNIPLSDNTVIFANGLDSKVSTGVNYSDNLLPNGKVRFSGVVGSSVKKLVINGQEATINENTFTVELDLKEGHSTIDFTAQNADGKVINESHDQIHVFKDTVAPEVTLTNPANGSVPEITNDNKVEVAGKVTDSGSGVLTDPYSNKPIILVGNNAAKPSTLVETGDDGAFTTSILVDDYYKAYIKAVDKLGNSKLVTVNATTTKVTGHPKILFDNLGDSMWVTFLNAKSKNVKDGVWTLTGHVSEPVHELYINVFDKDGTDLGTPVKVNKDLTFSTQIKLEQGSNRVGVIIKDSEGNVVLNQGIMTYYDNVNPEFQLNVKVHGDKIYTNTEKTNVTGLVWDNTFGYTLFLNGEKVMSKGDDIGPVGRENNEMTFAKEVPSNDGDYLVVTAVDGFENVTENKYQFVLDKTAPEVSVSGMTDGDKLLLPGKLNVSVNEDTEEFTVTLDGQPYNGEEITTPGDKELHYVAKDLAGNVTEKTVTVHATVTYDVKPNDGFKADKDTLSFEKAVTVKDSLGNDINPVSVLPTKSLSGLTGVQPVEFKVTLPGGLEKLVTVKVDFGQPQSPQGSTEESPNQSQPSEQNAGNGPTVKNDHLTKATIVGERVSSTHKRMINNASNNVPYTTDDPSETKNSEQANQVSESSVLEEKSEVQEAKGDKVSIKEENSTDSKSEEKTSKGDSTLLGWILGISLLLVLIAALLFFLLKRRNKDEE